MSLTSYQLLRRATAASLLFGLEGYEYDQLISERIKILVPQVEPKLVSELALELRSQYQASDTAFLLARELARQSQPHRLVATTLAQLIIQPTDAIAFLNLYWQEGKQPIAKQVKQGLAAALQNFDAEALAACSVKQAIRLRDILFLVHAKPKDAKQAALWQQLANSNLPKVKTWQQYLDSGADKKLIFEQLLRKQQIPTSVVLAKLRKLEFLGVEKALVAQYLLQQTDLSEVSTLHFIAAAQAVPAWQDILETAMLKALNTAPKLTGKTLVLVDRAWSMGFSLDCYAVEPRGDLNRTDIAAAITLTLGENCPDLELWWFSIEQPSLKKTFSRFMGKDIDPSSWFNRIPAEHGFKLIEQLQAKMSLSDLNAALALIVQQDYDRLIVITHDVLNVPIEPKHGLNYLINLDCKQKHVHYGQWIRVDGMTDTVISFTRNYEQAQSAFLARK